MMAIVSHQKRRKPNAGAGSATGGASCGGAPAPAAAASAFSVPGSNGASHGVCAAIAQPRHLAACDLVGDEAPAPRAFVAIRPADRHAEWPIRLPLYDHRRRDEEHRQFARVALE